jgi:hypothetical protein
MKTESLIEHLTQTPAPRQTAGQIFAKAILVGGLIATALTLSLLGPRRDVIGAMQGWHYWAKFLYPLTLSIAAYLVLARMAKPGATVTTRSLWIALPLLVMAGLGFWQWNVMPDSAHGSLFYGHSWRACPFLIVLISAPVFAATIWALRKLAPTKPITTGAVAGLFAGALGAWIYAFHCNESALVFVSIWYTAGIAAMSAIGGVTGRWLLKW